MNLRNGLITELIKERRFHLQICKNTHCIRHASTIPDNLPEWELFAYSDFRNKCKNYKEK